MKAVTKSIKILEILINIKILKNCFMEKKSMVQFIHIRTCKCFKTERKIYIFVNILNLFFPILIPKNGDCFFFFFYLLYSISLTYCKNVYSKNET